ncbi:MAG TPA: FecR family protein [Kofleriaceae bacterium]|nr:FecR family protein [Kofleriaceae bacterium]
MSDDSDYLWDKTGEDPEVEGLEKLLGGYAHDAPLREPPAARDPRDRTEKKRGRRTAIIIGGVLLAAAAAVIVALLWTRKDEGAGTQLAAVDDAGVPGFAFEVTGGAAMCNGDPQHPGGAGFLRVGSWLETEPGATANVKVADIGDVKLKPNSRLRLVATGPNEHRLELERGKLSARVTARPRLFVIDTPAAKAVDLGCAYDLEVDEHGVTHVRVTSGSISLEGHDLTSWIPWGFEATADRGRGPGTPVRTDAPSAFKEAIARFDAAGAGGGWSMSPLATIVDEAGAADAPTLWNLLARTDGPDRIAVFRRLDEVAIRPEWVLEEDVLSLQPQALESWRESLEGTWNLGPP